MTLTPEFGRRCLLLSHQQRGILLHHHHRCIWIAYLILLSTSPTRTLSADPTVCFNEDLEKYADAASLAIASQISLTGKVAANFKRTSDDFFQAEFRIVEVHKGRDLLTSSGLEKNARLVASWGKRPDVLFPGGKAAEIAAPESSSSCRRPRPMTVGHQYLVFLNGSTWEMERKGGKLIVYWMSSLPERFSKAAVKAIKEDACDQCAMEPRNVRMTPRTFRGKFGHPITLSCRAEAKPAPRVTWLKDGVPLDSLSARFEIENDRRSSTLTILEAVVEDAGLYTCHAGNAVGSAKSVSSNVLVVGPSEMTRPHSVLCSVQYYCLNQGTCWHVPKLNTSYCICEYPYDGHRCMNVRGPEGVLGASSLSDPLVIVGLLLVGLVFILLMFIIYLVARQPGLLRRELDKQLSQLSQQLTKRSSATTGSGRHSTTTQPDIARPPSVVVTMATTTDPAPAVVGCNGGRNIVQLRRQDNGSQDRPAVGPDQTEHRPASSGRLGGGGGAEIDGAAAPGCRRSRCNAISKTPDAQSPPKSVNFGSEYEIADAGRHSDGDAAAAAAGNEGDLTKPMLVDNRAAAHVNNGSSSSSSNNNNNNNNDEVDSAPNRRLPANSGANNNVSRTLLNGAVGDEASSSCNAGFEARPAVTAATAALVEGPATATGEAKDVDSVDKLNAVLLDLGLPTVSRFA